MFDLDFLLDNGCEEIIAIYQTGSSTIVDEPNDYDFLVIVNFVPKGFAQLHLKHNNVDYFIWHIDKVLYLYNQSEHEYIDRNYLFITHAIQPENLVYGELVTDKTLLDIQENWLKISGNIFDDIFKDENNKFLWYISVPLEFIKNKKVEKTKEIKYKATKINKKNFTKEEFDDLRFQIKKNSI